MLSYDIYKLPYIVLHFNHMHVLYVPPVSKHFCSDLIAYIMAIMCEFSVSYNSFCFDNITGIVVLMFNNF